MRRPLLQQLSQVMSAVALLAAVATFAMPRAAYAQHEESKKESVDFITPHITDSRHLEIPWPNAHLAK